MTFSGTKRDESTHKIVAEVSARHAESPHRSDDERSSDGKQDDREQLELGVVEERQFRLLGKGALIEVVAEDPKREDGDGEGVAAPPRVVEREARQDLVAVFWFVSGEMRQHGAILARAPRKQVRTHLGGRQCSRRAGSGKR